MFNFEWKLHDCIEHEILKVLAIPNKVDRYTLTIGFRAESFRSAVDPSAHVHSPNNWSPAIMVCRDYNTRGKNMHHSASVISQHRLYRSPRGHPPTVESTRFAIRPRLPSLPFPATPPMNLPVFPIGYPWLKVYIAHRQTCPNCSSSCYANDHICYDSARRGSSSTTVSCHSAVETLRSTLLRKGACFIQRYVAMRAAYAAPPLG